MNAFEIPELRFSLVPGGAITEHKFVSCSSTGKAIVATASTAVIGASMNRVTVTNNVVAPANQVAEIARGIVMVEAGAQVTAGAKVAADANGDAITYVSETTGDACGIALTSGTDGQLIAVLMV